MAISALTKLTAVIGNPIRHSLSPLLHNSIYAKEGIDAVMLAFENASVERLIEAVRALSVELTAVTLPHKQAIFPCLDEVDGVAKDIGAVNTVINRGGKLTGFNTDVVGFSRSLQGVELKNKNALILGAGGAARVATYYLKQQGANIFCHNNQTMEDARLLMKSYKGIPVESEELGGVAYDLIVNATPVGMTPNVAHSPISKKHIRSGSIVFDVIYTPLETQLMKDAEERGARAISGLGMLVWQGLEQERLWLGRKIQDEGYTEILRAKLSNNYTR